ncbi:hypothetical protein G9A89_021567 [Geosiphon pyriformis]|nr:hypothetical protein G9A89_021567 [Geosiphon pyriformis]
MLGKVLHLAADVVMVSAILAGIKKSSGLTVATDKIEDPDIKKAVVTWLNVGEMVVDYGIVFMKNSTAFRQVRENDNGEKSTEKTKYGH